MDNFIVRVLENSQNFPIDISQNRTAFPMETVSFSWTKDGQPVNDGPALDLTYSNVTFSSIDRQDSGNYSVFASNIVGGREVGNDTGNFYLDVICKLCMHSYYFYNSIMLYYVCTCVTVFVCVYSY